LEGNCTPSWPELGHNCCIEAQPYISVLVALPQLEKGQDLSAHAFKSQWGRLNEVRQLGLSSAARFLAAMLLLLLPAERFMHWHTFLLILTNSHTSCAVCVP
jgi:hypothetical protein